MSREEILKFLEAHEAKKTPKPGLSWTDRLIGLAIIGILHTMVPTSEHAGIGQLKDYVSVLAAKFDIAQDTVKDHETRIRVLEYDDKTAKR